MQTSKSVTINIKNVILKNIDILIGLLKKEKLDIGSLKFVNSFNNVLQ